MGIHDTEKQIYEELKQLTESEPQNTPPSQELLNESLEENDLEIDGTQEEEPEEQEEGEDLTEIDEEQELSDVDEEQELDKGEEEEEKASPAGMRHKIKAEKEERKRLERETQELRERLARLEGKAEATQQAVPEIKEEIPDREIDPEGHSLWKADQLEKKFEEIQKENTRLNAERQWQNMESEHVKSNSDYADAKQFLIDQETAKIKELHPHATSSQISQHIKEQEYITVGNAARAGIDPLQHIEFLAFKEGFRPGEKKKEVKKNPARKSNIKAINRNSKRNASIIGGSSAGAGDEKASPEQLLNMSMEEINSFGRDKFEKSIRKIESRSS
jgi:hypothetical protein